MQITNELDELMIDYQNIAYDTIGSTLNIGFIYKGPCRSFLVEFFSENGVLQRETTALKEVIINGASPVIPLSNNYTILNDTELLYFRVTARDHIGNICSDARSQQTFYQFQSMGKSSNIQVAS